MGEIDLKDYFQVQFEGLEKALKLQHKEYLRRLKDLNGEAGRLRDIQTTYVPRETFESYVKEQSNAQKQLSDKVEETRDRLEKATSEAIKRLEDQIRELREDSKQLAGVSIGTDKATKAQLDSWATKLAVVVIVINVLFFAVPLVF